MSVPTKRYSALDIDEQNGYYYIKLGKGRHGAFTKVWLSKPIVDELMKKEQISIKEKHVKVPIENATIVKTEKGGYVIRPGKNTIVTYVTRSGYRGRAYIEKFDISPLNFIKAPYYSSPCGSLGEDDEYLFEIEDKIRFLEYRDGRRVSDHHVWRILNKHGYVLSDVDPDVEGELD